jgi:hypothetical protein
MQTVGRAFYESSNGDRWLVVRDGESGDIFVRHEPNAASGGRPADTEFASFMDRYSETPQAKALRELIDRLRAEENRRRQPANDEE